MPLFFLILNKFKLELEKKQTLSLLFYYLPVGMLSSTISSSGTLSKYFMSALIELPWAAINTFLPDFLELK